VDSPGARWNVGVPRLSLTSRCVVLTFGHAYNMRVTTADDSVQSSNVDVGDTTSWRIATSLPALSAPSASSWRVRGRYPTGPNICVRSSTSRTGRCVLRAAIAASTTCDQADPLQPNPPPTYGEMTRTFSAGIPSFLASALRAPMTPWVES
jgi:hypothetical protein